MRHASVLLSVIFAVCIISCHSGQDTRNKANHKTNGRDNKSAKGFVVLDSAIFALESSRVLAIEEMLSQNWNMEDADQKHWNQNFWDSVYNKRKFPSLVLFRDHLVSENPRCFLQMGYWKLDKRKGQLILRFNEGNEQTFTLVELSLHTMVLRQTLGDGEQTLTFSSDGLVYRNPGSDPYYPDNNRWRVKPSRSEKESAVRARTKAYVHFYSLFYRDNYLRQQSEISYIGLPCSFEWFNGGIGLPNTLDLDKKWIGCYYSQNEALEAYDMLKKIIESRQLDWTKHKGSWVLQTQNVLDQIHDRL